MYRLFCNNKTLECINFFEQCLDVETDKSLYSSQVFENTLDKIKKEIQSFLKNLSIKYVIV